MSDSFALPRLRSKRRKPRGPMPPDLIGALAFAFIAVVNILVGANALALGEPAGGAPLLLGALVLIGMSQQIWSEFKRWWESGE